MHKARHQVTISNTSQAPTCPFPVPPSIQKYSSMSPLYNNVQTRTIITIYSAIHEPSYSLPGLQRSHSDFYSACVRRLARRYHNHKKKMKE